MEFGISCANIDTRFSENLLLRSSLVDASPRNWENGLIPAGRELSLLAPSMPFACQVVMRPDGSRGSTNPTSGEARGLTGGSEGGASLVV